VGESSFVVSLYHVIVISELTPIEMFSLLARATTRRYIHPRCLLLFRSTFSFFTSKQQYLVVNLESSISLTARLLVPT